VKADPLKILLIRLRLIGDVVLTTPAVQAVRRAWPDARISYLVEPLAAPVVLSNPHLDEVIVAPLTRGVRRWRDDLALAARLRRAHFDIVVDFHGGPRSSWLTWASGARRRVGYTVTGRSWMYTTRVFRPRTHRRRHSVENQWDLLRAIVPGIAAPTPLHDAAEMSASPEAGRRVDARLDREGIGHEHAIVVVHVGAGNEYRRWPESAFADVVLALVQADGNRRIILTSGPAQADTAARVVERVRVHNAAAASAIVSWCDLGLADLRHLVERASLFVGGDSGPAHIASTTETPMVVIFGPTLPEVWGPWRDPSRVTEIVDTGALPCRPCDQRVCEPGDFRCLRALPAAAVVAAAERAIRRHAERRK
jgi:ADP-heptose:LPS heptosyltransferase